jgi:hypothetical protein
VVRTIPEEIFVECSSLPDMQGAWIILQPIVADIVFTGKWADQLSRGDFSVFIGNAGHIREKDEVVRTFFQGEKI